MVGKHEDFADGVVKNELLLIYRTKSYNEFQADNPGKYPAKLGAPWKEEDIKELLEDITLAPSTPQDTP